MSDKAYSGLKYRATTKYGETKEYILQTLGDLQTAMVLVSSQRHTFMDDTVSAFISDGIREEHGCLGE